MATTDALVRAGIWKGAAEQLATAPIYLTGRWADIGTADSSWVVSPVAGTITKWYTVLDGAITGTNETCTLEIAATLVTGSTITVVTAGSAAGTVDSATCTAANTVAAGTAIAAKTAGDSTGATIATFVIEITPSGA